MYQWCQPANTPTLMQDWVFLLRPCVRILNGDARYRTCYHASRTAYPKYLSFCVLFRSARTVVHFCCSFKSTESTCDRFTPSIPRESLHMWRYIHRSACDRFALFPLLLASLCTCWCALLLLFWIKWMHHPSYRFALPVVHFLDQMKPTPRISPLSRFLNPKHRRAVERR